MNLHKAVIILPMDSDSFNDLIQILDAVRNLMREKEDAWLDESISALSGLTPRQVADPTRREDLAALLNEFDRHGEVPSPAVTFDVSRLRLQLGVFNS